MTVKQVPYPPAPWKLKGRLLVATRLVDIQQVRPFVPPGLRILPVFPGKTAAGCLFVVYGPGSTLQYNELTVFPALVYRGGRVGIWVSHIFVDDEQSLAGGWEMWGVPKEMAEFEWQLAGTGMVSAVSGDEALASAIYRSYGPWLGLPLFGAAFGGAAGEYRWFRVVGRVLGRRVNVQLTIPPESPLSALPLREPFFAFEGGLVEAEFGDIRSMGGHPS